MNTSSSNTHTSLKPARGQTRSRKISRVWCLARDMGMSKDKDGELYLLVESLTGKDSIAALSLFQLDQVLDALSGLKHKQKRRKAPANYKDNTVAYMATPAQKQLAADYLNKLAPVMQLKNPDAYIEAISRRTFQKRYNRLSREEMQKLIEILKSILGREEKK